MYRNVCSSSDPWKASVETGKFWFSWFLWLYCWITCSLHALVGYDDVISRAETCECGTAEHIALLLDVIHEKNHS